MYELTLEVTQEDISRGEPSDESQCPIAQALLRYFGPNYDVSVDREEILVWVKPEHDVNHGEELYFSTSDDAEDFIRAFDNAEQVHPETFTFTLCQTRED